jgi:hypothetical protein
MKTIDEKIEEVEKTMLKEYKRGQNNEITNEKYRKLLKEKQRESIINIMQLDEKDNLYKDAKYYENQFKPKDFNIKLK